MVGAIITAIGAGGMPATAGSFTNYMVCKCISGIGIGDIIAVGPIYGVECTVASKRGPLMSLYNIGLALGNAVAAAVCARSASYRLNLAWQLQIICQLPLSFVLGLGLHFFRESPRWLLVASKEESARNCFSRFYNKDPQSDEITRHIFEVQRHIEMEKARERRAFRSRFSPRTTEDAPSLRYLFLWVLLSLSQVHGSLWALFLKEVGISNPNLTTLSLRNASLPTPSLARSLLNMEGDALQCY